MIQVIQEKPSIFKSKILKFGSLALCTGTIFFCSNASKPAFAALDLSTEIEKITAVSDTLETIVTAFTSLLVGTGGISAAFQIFRRVLLQNI